MICDFTYIDQVPIGKYFKFVDPWDIGNHKGMVYRRINDEMVECLSFEKRDYFKAWRIPKHNFMLCSSFVLASIITLPATL